MSYIKYLEVWQTKVWNFNPILWNFWLPFFDILKFYAEKEKVYKRSVAAKIWFS